MEETRGSGVQLNMVKAPIQNISLRPHTLGSLKLYRFYVAALVN